ncbi:MAG: molybdate ABC transporter permease subunit [Candidatus Sericytochromatia bacterium]
MNIQPLLLTLKLALITTFILLIIGLPIAYFLAFSKFKLKFILEALINTPLVLPPSVLGFYLLIAFNPNNYFAKFFKYYFDINLLFSFEGLVIGSIIFSLPFMVQHIQSGFQSLPISLKEASYTLGKSELETLFYVLIPNIKHSILSGIVLSFAHTIGEFGVVLMIGGNIPDKTKVASIAIYDEVEALNYSLAHFYSLVMLITSILLLSLVYFINNKYNIKKS